MSGKSRHVERGGEKLDAAACWHDIRIVGTYSGGKRLKSAGKMLQIFKSRQV